MKILAIQNRMGIGDTIIFLPFIKAISKKFNSPVSLLVKENSKADQFLNQTTYIDKIIHLKRDNKKSERHDGINGFFKLAKDLNQYNFDKVFIFNSSLFISNFLKVSKTTSSFIWISGSSLISKLSFSLINFFGAFVICCSVFLNKGY